jgi:hypothetical protein
MGNQALAKRNEARFIGPNILPGLVEMLAYIPEELLNFKTIEASDFLMARAALSREKELLSSGARKDSVEWPSLDNHDCVEIVRTALSECEDEAISTSGTVLNFLEDPDLEKTLQTDFGSVESAIPNGEWKAATVISGSIIEALLLWAVERHQPQEIEVAIQKALTDKQLSQKPNPDPSWWHLPELIEIAYGLGEITDDTLCSARPSKNFRNAIHPGRVMRTGIQCDRGMAYTTYGATLNVVRDLSAKYP